MLELFGFLFLLQLLDCFRTHDWIAPVFVFPVSEARVTTVLAVAGLGFTVFAYLNVRVFIETWLILIIPVAVGSSFGWWCFPVCCQGFHLSVYSEFAFAVGDT